MQKIRPPRPLTRLAGALLLGWAIFFNSGSAPAQEQSDVPFSTEWLTQKARDLAREPYAYSGNTLPAWVRDIDYDAYQKIRFKPEHALWKKLDLPFHVEFFHLGLYFFEPVRMHEVVQGRTHPVHFAEDLFSYEKIAPHTQTGDLGFAGLKGFAGSDSRGDFFSFLGASYFRAVGASMQYGLSARGIAINTGMVGPEEFPRFTDFWLERPARDAKSIVVHALLDGPSVTGAYTFTITPPGEYTVMEIEVQLFARRAVERIGLAPLTSMFHHGENDHRVADDFRPEIHDSDGLSISTGSGEWIWRPLINPPYVLVNTFVDQAVRGFGLLQRDRDFNDYQDDGAHYHLRPSLWVEPLGDWGRGAVMLVEIPAADETLDNIVAFWKPAVPMRAGDQLTLKYRLHWGAKPPVGPGAGEVMATRVGEGGIPGQKNRIRSRKFVVDFKGGNLSSLTLQDKVEAVVTASRGQILGVVARPIPALDGWRSHFDLVVDGPAPVDLRLYLRGPQGALTETWLYQWIPR